MNDSSITPSPRRLSAARAAIASGIEAGMTDVARREWHEGQYRAARVRQDARALLARAAHAIRLGDADYQADVLDDIQALLGVDARTMPASRVPVGFFHTYQEE